MARSRLDVGWAAPALAGVAVVLALAWLAHARHERGSPTRTQGRRLEVPRATGLIVDDGSFEEDAWRNVLLGGAFVDDAMHEARPHSEARFAWSERGLHVALYAADGDIEEAGPNADAFLVHAVGARSLELRATPHRVEIVDASHRELAAGHDVDGTVGDPTDDDEEWVTELTIPWVELGLRGTRGETLEWSATRCDVVKDGGRRCASMPTHTLVLR